MPEKFRLRSNKITPLARLERDLAVAKSGAAEAG